jgi:hypothetical protein
MYQLTKIGAVILTAAALAGWLVPALAGPTVPYRGHGTGVVDSFDRTTFIQTLHGEGEATHLGHFTFVGSETLRFTSNPTVFPHGGLVPAGGQLTFMAADGSTLTGEILRGAFFHVTPDVPVVLQLEINVTGVTGELAGVNAHVIMNALAQGADQGEPFTFTMEGTFTFP